jgi:hypothetical protein
VSTPPEQPYQIPGTNPAPGKPGDGSLTAQEAAPFVPKIIS